MPLYLFIYLLIYLFVYFGYILYSTYASKVRAACLIVPHNDGSKAPIGCWGEEGLA